jgi:ABC-2 type transport system ATP-binding protein
MPDDTNLVHGQGMDATSTPPPVVVDRLTKAYGSQRAVDDLSFTVDAGRVTGFLGANGAGKTTTLRMLLGLATPTSGTTLVLGRPYVEHRSPSSIVGTLLDATAFHPGRRAWHEVAIHAAAAGIAATRVDEVLAEVGLAGAARKRVGALSLGMRQRLGLAVALLGTPDLLVLDEPANGLDPAGMHWLRDLLRSHAARGAAVLVSSHVLAELALFADDVVVLERGRLVTQSSLTELLGSAGERVHVRSPSAPTLRALLERAGATVTMDDSGALVAVGMSARRIGELASSSGVVLHELRTEIQSLEEIFLELTHADGEIR